MPPFGVGGAELRMTVSTWYVCPFGPICSRYIVWLGAGLALPLLSAVGGPELGRKV